MQSANDILITIRGQLDAIVSHRMQRVLNITQQWCRKKGLRINPEKTTIVPFIKRRKLHLTAPTLNGTVGFKREVKYLGVTLDQKLTWNFYLKKSSDKRCFSISYSPHTLGRNWGLKSKMIHWSYTAIIRPMVTYAAAVWWPKTGSGATTTAKDSEVCMLQHHAGFDNLPYCSYGGSSGLAAPPLTGLENCL